MLRNFLPAVCLLFFLLVLLTCCVICEPSLAGKSDVTGQNPLISVFKQGTEFEKNEEGAVTKKTFKSFTSPSLNYVGNVLVVFAQAEDTGKKTCDIVEGYFKVSTDGGLTDKFAGVTSESKWTKRVVSKDNADRCRGSPTTVVNGKDIFVFFKNSSITGDNNMEYWVIGGHFENNDNGITWNASFENVTTKLQSTIEDLNNIVPVDNGNIGIVVNNTIVVPVWYTKKGDNQFISIITNSTDREKIWKLVISKYSVEEKYPAVVEWGGKLIMITSSTKGHRKVYESINMGEKWTEVLESLSGVWGNTKQRTEKKYGGQYGFIAVEIEIEAKKSNKEKVMFLTQPVAQPVTEVKSQAESDYKLHLWMTDNQRVFDVGAISAKIEQDTSSTLLYANKNLFVAYETGEKEQSAINVMHIKDQLATIKHVLKTWDEHDKELLHSCFAADETIKSDNTCTDDNTIPTNGLVGFLSGNGENKTHWNDKYLCVNATLKADNSATITNIKDGLQFSGAGASATWPVGNQGQNQRYHFANYGFTLVATVTIDSDTNENANSILGIGLEGGSNGKKTIGLWCSNGKWGVGDGKSTADTISNTENCANEKTYQVALTFKDETVSVYIKGNKIEELSGKSINAENEKITHFYFGANNGEQTTQPSAAVSHVTVKNVLLYNRQFGDDEISKLKPKQIKPQESIKTPKEDIKADQRDDNTAASGDQQSSPTLPQGSTGDDNIDEKNSSPSRTEDGDVGGGVRVFSLLLAVLCVSVPLLHL